MKAFEWMINSTPQREWIEKRGISTPMAFYSGSLGAGLYLVSLYFDIPIGMVVAWFIVGVFKSVFHMIDLYHPLRAIRMLLRPQTSWISRGLIITLVFLIASFATIVLKVLYSGNANVYILEVVSVLAAVMLSIYPGFLLRSSPGIKVWQSMWVPVIFLSCGVLGGLGGMELFKAINLRQASLIPYGYYYTVLLITMLLLLLFAFRLFLLSETVKLSVKRMFIGSLKGSFWIGIIFLCVLMPFLLLMMNTMGADLSLSLQLVNLLCALALGITSIFIILKMGIYEPLL